LWEIFDVLGFFEHEKEKALEGFKKKFANEVLKELQNSFSTDQHKWIAEAVATKEYDKSDPKIAEIQETINSSYSKEKLDEISRKAFKTILASYVNFMIQKIDSEKSEKLDTILNNF